MTLAREILRSNLGARHVYTVFDGIHLRPTHVNGMYELVNQSLFAKEYVKYNMYGVSYFC